MKHLSIFSAVAFLCAASLAAQPQGKPSSPGRPSSPPASPAAPGKVSPPDGPGMPSTGKSSNPSSDKSSNSANSGKSTSELLAQNTKLSAKLQTLLGKDPNVACEGFKNLGACVAAAHVSSNLGISFDELKTRTTGTDAKSLGDAIHAINPDVNAKAEVKKAQQQAKEDMKEPH